MNASICHAHVAYNLDVVPAKDADNSRRLVTAVRQGGFTIDDAIECDIMFGKKASDRMKDRMDLHLLDLFWGRFRDSM